MSQNKQRDMLVLPGSTTFEKIGQVEVETGLLLLIDPSYIDSEWKKERFLDKRVYLHKLTGQLLTYKKDFSSYQEPIPHLGKSLEELIDAGECERLPEPPGSTLSYNNCVLTTHQSCRGGIVGGLGTVLATPEGNEAYSVFVERDDRGQIIRVLLDLTVGADEVELE